MRMESSAFDTKAGFFGFPASKSNESIDMTVYLDAQGYWYVPVENYYVRVHPIDDIQNGMAKMLNVSIEAVVESQVLDQLAYLAYLNLDLDAGSDWIKNYLSPEFIGSYTEQTLKPLLEKLAQLQAMKLNGLPTFVHFPYFFSPTLARSQFSPNEQTGSWRGQDNCTKMTLASGYLVVFDRYGRLIHLRDTDGDTADYSYDKEVTLASPEYAQIKDFSSFMKINKN